MYEDKIVYVDENTVYENIQGLRIEFQGNSNLVIIRKDNKFTNTNIILLSNTVLDINSCNNFKDITITKTSSSPYGYITIPSYSRLKDGYIYKITSFSNVTID